MRIINEKKPAPLRRLLFLVLLAGFLLIAPAAALAKEVKVVVLPWKVNSATEMDFVRDAMIDMLSSRIGSASLATGDELRVVRTDVLRDALREGKKGESAEAAAARVGKKLGLDYVLFGSLTVLGDSLSLDSKLLDVNKGGVTPFFSRGTGLDSVVEMSDKLSKEVTAAISASLAPPPAKAAPPPPSAAPKASGKAATPEGALTAPAPAVMPAPVPVPIPVPAPGKKKAEEAGEEGEGGFIVKPEKKPAEEAFIKSKKFEGLYTSMVAADLDKDGVKEIFILKKTGVLIGVIKGGAFEVIKEMNTGTSRQSVSLSAIDSDHDGSIEVYVSAAGGIWASSYAIEYVDGEYSVTIPVIRWFLRTVRDGATELLIGQAFNLRDGFKGEVRELAKAGEKVVNKGPYGVELPRGVDLYKFALFNFNSGRPDELDLVTLDSRGRIKVFTEVEGSKGGAWEEYWRGEDRYGGTLNVVEPPEGSSLGEVHEPVPVEGGLLYADLDGDGVTELIVRRNVPGGLGKMAERPRSFKKGTITALAWDGEFLTEKWRTREVQGYLSDFIIDDLDGDGRAEIVMLVSEGGGIFFGWPKSYILSYRMPL